MKKLKILKIFRKKFNNLVYKLLYSKELKANFFSSLIKLVLSSFENEYALFKALNDNYGEKQGELVFYLSKFLLQNKKYHNILIFDNINFWATEYIDLLHIISNDKKTKSFYKKILDNTTIIVSYTDNYYISNGLQKYINSLKNNIFSENFFKSSYYR